MKIFVLLFMALCFATTIVAESSPTASRFRPKGLSRPSGGIVEKQYDGNVFRVQNIQKTIPLEKLSELTQKIRLTSRIPIELSVSTPDYNDYPISQANALVAQDHVGAGIIIIENNKFPIITASPDARWAILNVSALALDSPTNETLVDRFTKVYWCAVARALGVGNSSYPGCVLVPFADLKGLDGISATQPCPEPFNKMIDSAKACGIHTLFIASFRTACQQGWAPSPTNDVQRSIWEEVKAEKNKKPSNPIKVNFDPKTAPKVEK